MLFNSLDFYFFLPIVFLLYWFVFRSRRWQNLLVVIASYVFYGWWDWRFLLLIAFTSLCSFGSGLLIERYEGRRWDKDDITGYAGREMIERYLKMVEFLPDSCFYEVGSHLRHPWLYKNIILSEMAK